AGNSRSPVEIMAVGREAGSGWAAWEDWCFGLLPEPQARAAVGLEDRVCGRGGQPERPAERMGTETQAPPAPTSPPLDRSRGPSRRAQLDREPSPCRYGDAVHGVHQARAAHHVEGLAYHFQKWAGWPIGAALTPL